jgi:glycosyltransferase involved in cell wall biosynthesis/GT2 family glycosyltransferase
MTSAPEFALNGRFLTQKGTGVQRYAMSVAQAMNSALAEQQRSGCIIAPSGAPDPGLDHLPLITPHGLSGHAWEQIMLPAQWSGRLLNLCNTAAVAKTDQIVCIHDANIFSAPASYSRAFRWFYHGLQPALVRRSVRITTVSHAAARQIARHLPIQVEDIAVLANGHEHALIWDAALAQAAPDLLARTTEKNDRKFILALGSRAKHKNLQLLIDAAPGLDEIGIDVVIAGGGADIFVGGALKQRSNVHLAGRVSDHDLAYLLDRALCLAFPSLTEGFGLPIVEAMARGCPVIAAQCASMPEVCGNAALLASPFDPSAWINHVHSLKKSPELAAELVGRGHEQVKQFSWSNTAEGYLDLLDQPAVTLRSHQPANPNPPRMAVVVATRGRPATVAATVRHLLKTQTLKPVTVIVSCVDREDAGDLVEHPDVTVVTGAAGLAAQRNTALASVPRGTELLAFFDDDFVADKDWLASAAQVFRDESQVVGFTGHVVADGIKGPGIAFDEALSMLQSAPKSDDGWTERYSPYGCNMAFRFSALGDTRFDERLVLYAWLEDRDFAAALARRGGRFVKSATAFGVHMGIKSGRVSGIRLGYSQIANPLYMLKKGTITRVQTADHIARNLAINMARSVWSEPFVDRRGRARGNLTALADLLCGRLRPERAADLSAKAKTIALQAKVDVK